MGFAFVLVVDFVYLSDVEKKFYDMYMVFALLVRDILEYMVQKYLVVINHHQMISNLYDEVLFYFYFAEKMGNFHYDPVEDVN